MAKSLGPLLLLCASVLAPQLYGQQPAISQVAAGGFHSLAVRADGTVTAWGSNEFGQLGDGTTTDRSGAVLVPSFGGAASADGSLSFSIVVKSDGSVWGWGSSISGELGIVDPLVLTPRQIAGISNVEEVSAGWFHVVARKQDGTVWTWGANTAGQLGDTTTTDRTTPVQVTLPATAVSVAAGQFHTLAALSNGEVWAWGFNGTGALGDGSLLSSTQPVQVSGLTNVDEVTAGEFHSVARKADGTVWGWGESFPGQIGDGSNGTPVLTPVQATGITTAVEVAAFRDHTLVRMADNTVWGYGQNASGELGDGTNVSRTTAVQVSGLTGSSGIAAGFEHSLSWKNNDSIDAWGSNGVGQLGDGFSLRQNKPVQVTGVSSAVSAAGGGFHTVAVRADGSVLTWGGDASGQLGNGGTGARNTPAFVAGLTGVADADANEFHTLARKTNGTVFAWGQNTSGQLGDGTTTIRNTPIQIPGLANVAQVSAGANFSLALINGGLVRSWGGNNFGQLGDGTNTARLSPVTINSLSNVGEIASGIIHGVALRKDGTVWTWGWNEAGQLGDGTNTDRSSPVQVSGLPRIAAIGAGREHTLAVAEDGTVWAWGENEDGQLGDNTTQSKSTPIQIPTLTNIVRVAGGRNFSFAVRSDGTVWAWGANSLGQLGDGTTTQRLIPVQVPNLAGVADVRTTLDHAVALLSDGTTWTWGAGSEGRLGTGSFRRELTPITGGLYETQTAVTMFTPATGTLNAPTQTSYSVTSWAGPPTGNVMVVDGAQSCTGSVGAGQCSMTSLAGPNRTVAAKYMTDGEFANSCINAALNVSCTVNLSSSTLNAGMGSTNGSFNVTGLPGCAWQVSKNRAWIMITSRIVDQGNGTVTFNVAANTGPARSGSITVGGQTFTINQAASAATPTSVSASPASGSGLNQQFTFTFRHPAGWQNLQVLNLLINDFLDGRNACYLAYVPTSAVSGALYLVNDAGDAGGPYASVTLPSSGVAGNSQCMINGNGSSASASGDTLTLTLSIGFKSAFAGDRIIYMAARDGAGLNSGWSALGAWLVPGEVLSGPNPISVAPGRSIGSGQTYTFVFEDTNGWQNLGVVNILINDFLDGRNACYLAYSAPSDQLYVVNDAGDALEAGLANSQCSVTSVTAAGGGNTLTLSLDLVFSPGFAGDRVVYMAARSVGDVLNSGWKAKGSMTVLGP